MSTRKSLDQAQIGQRSTTSRDDVIEDDRNSSSSSFGSDPGLDEFSRGLAAIDATRSQIQHIRAAVQNEIASRLASGLESAQSEDSVKHISDGTPLSSQEPPTSPDIAAENVTKENFSLFEWNQLLDWDQDFHKHLTTIDGIRQWWITSREEWAANRDRLTSSDLDIQNARLLQEDFERGEQRQSASQSDIGERHRCSHLIEAAERRKETIFQWFEDRRELLKTVWKQYAELDSSLSHRNKSAASIPMTTIESSAGLYQEAHSPGQIEWLSSTEKYLQWARMVADDIHAYWGRLENEGKYHQQKLDSVRAQYASCKKNVEATKSAILRRNLRAEAEVQNVRAATLQDEDSRIEALLQHRHEEIAFEKIQLELGERDEQALSDLVKETEMVSAGIKADTTAMVHVESALLLVANTINSRNDLPPGDDIRLMRAMYDVCCISYRHRYGVADEIRAILGDLQTQRAKRIQIVEALWQHYRTKSFLVPELGAYCTKAEKSKADQIARRFEKVRNIFDKELSDFFYVSNVIKTLYNGPEIPDVEPEVTDIYMPNIPSLAELQRLRTPGGEWDPNTKGWGSQNMTAATAKMILEIRPHLIKDKKGVLVQSSQCWGDLLVDTYTSPDIAQDFIDNKNTWTFEQFSNKLNGYLSVTVPQRELEAFLIYCSQVNELFHRGFFSRQISWITLGWETVYDNQLRGLPRKKQRMEFKIDIKKTAAQEVLQNHAHSFGAGLNKSRLVPIRAVYEGIKHHLPKIMHFSEETFEKFVAEWTDKGQFFCSTSRTHLSTQSNIVRACLVVIDDPSWNLPPYSGVKYYPPPSMPKYYPPLSNSYPAFKVMPLPIFRTIDIDLHNKDITSIPSFPGFPRLQERDLYDGMYLDETANLPKRMNWEVTRAVFHAYLRWCTESANGGGRGKILSLRRTGEIKFKSGHWDRVFRAGMEPGDVLQG